MGHLQVCSDYHGRIVCCRPEPQLLEPNLEQELVELLPPPLGLEPGDKTAAHRPVLVHRPLLA
jgi:hypothetical protein